MNNPNGATAEFARNLDSLLRPGADSRIDLASATSVELEHNPVLHDVRYAAVEAYLRSILPPNISVERLDRKEHHVSVNFYIIPNDE